MSNIISVHGYELHLHNGEPMVSDLDLAKRLEYSQPRDIRKLIKRLLEKGNLLPDQIRATVARLPNKAESTSFHLGEKASLKVITKSETEKADQITDEIIDVFIDARNGSPKKRQSVADPVIQQAKQADALLSTYLKAGKALGADAPMARAIAVDQVKTTVGLDFTPLLTNNKVEEAPVTPTELGKDLGISGRKMNALLEEHGFQCRDENNDWQPTDKGKPFCTVNPYKAPKSDHTGYRVLWYKRIAEELTKPS